MPIKSSYSSLVIGTTVAMAFSLSSCSSGNSFPEDSIQGYFTPLAASAPADNAAALDFAAPGSVAAMYVTEQMAHAQAQQDGGSLYPVDSEVLIEGQTVLMCGDGYEADGDNQDKYCNEYSNFEFDDDGKIVSFDAGNKPLEGRIALGNDDVIPISEIGTVKFLSSYITIGDELVVVVEVESYIDPLNIELYNATYVTKEGRPTSAKVSDGPMDLKSGRTANVAFWFPNVGLDGTLELGFMDTDYNSISVEVPTAQ